ncbi:MAG TPA: hypothetical protein VMT24_00440 [Aggregatilineaceae bacterium]|nr:hypothetical protein [Aggregatilineaceae bacterium]
MVLKARELHLYRHVRRRQLHKLHLLLGSGLVEHVHPAPDTVKSPRNETAD